MIDGSYKHWFREQWNERCMVQVMDQGARNGNMVDAGLDQGASDSHFI